MSQPLAQIELPVRDITVEEIQPYGIYLGQEVHRAGLSIPFYTAIEEGHNLPFEYRDKAVIRTARISQRPLHVKWLERHLHLTQLFLALGTSSMIVVLGTPTHATGAITPDLKSLKAFRIKGGHGILLWQGTWHEFPFAVDTRVTVLTANSAEVVDALARVAKPQAMDDGDVYKIDVAETLGVSIKMTI
jgi:ureidoglycolate lyase